MMFPVSRILEKKLCQSVQAPDEFHKQSGFDTNYIMGVKRTSSVLTFCVGGGGEEVGGGEEKGGRGRARDDKLVVVVWVVGGGGRGGWGRGGELLI